jgi:CRP-like cAMP-binding protein
MVKHNGVTLRVRARRALGKVARRSIALPRRPSANSLLAAIPRAEFQRLFAGLAPVTLKIGEVIQESGAPIRHVYFPFDCVVCLMTGVEDDRHLEVGIVGFEGVVGVALALGMCDSSARALVQSTGTALRVEAAHFLRALRQCPPLQRALDRYAHAKLVLARQTVACNCFHGREARLARWLLMTGDRVRSEGFFLTQAFLAGMLGVRRVTVTEAAGRLQQRNLIRYRRGNISILDRAGLEAVACRCYARLEGKAGTKV